MHKVSGKKRFASFFHKNWMGVQELYSTTELVYERNSEYNATRWPSPEFQHDKSVY